MPVFVNGMARGALPPKHPCLFGQCRKDTLRNADLVLLFGTPLDFRLSYGEAIPASAKLVQVDLDGAPHLLQLRKLNPGSSFHPGVLVSLFPLAESLAGVASRTTGQKERVWRH